MSRPPVTAVHTGDTSCPVRPRHDPCHTGCSEDGRTLDDMTALSVLTTWRRQIRGTVNGHGRAAPASAVAEGVSSILETIGLVDQHLDDAAPEIYRANPLANMWRRAYGAVSESAETQDALIGFTGGNPRKGITHTREDMLGEAADTAVAALLFIQSQTKNPDRTWLIFLGALDKARSRVPGASPFSPESGMSGQDATDNGITG